MTKSKILFLDDMDTRHFSFMKYASGMDVTYVWTADEAIDALKKTEFTQVFLDHDLSEEDIMVKVGEKSKVKTGMDVVDFIVTMEKQPQSIVIHSHNPPASTEMFSRLNESKQSHCAIVKIPFSTLINLYPRYLCD